MTRGKGGASATACPTCGGRGGWDDPCDALAWIRGLARQARSASPPARLEEARQHLDGLLALPVETCFRHLDDDPARHTSPLLLAVAFERIEGHLPRAPRTALEELDVVQAMAARVDASRPAGRRRRASAVITAWAYRIAGLLGVADLVGADHWAGMARDLLSSGVEVEGRGLALLDEQEGRVRLHQRRSAAAQRLLAGAARRFLALDDATAAARALLNLAEAQREVLPDEALATLALAQEAIDPYTEPYLYLCCQMERALVLCDLGDAMAADLLVCEHREVIEELRTIPSVALRAAWLRGRIALLLGDHDGAVAHYGEVRELALARDDAYDAALVSLDLALVYLDRGDLDALRQEARAIVPILAGEGLHEAAAAALSLYRDALLHQRAGRALIHRLKSYFETARMTPGRRFRAD